MFTQPRIGIPVDDPDIIVEGGTLITMCEGEDPVKDARVFVKRDRIVHIGAAGEDIRRFPGAEIIDARDAIIMPGLINAHCHVAMTLFRGLADDLPLKQWLFEKIFPTESRYLTPETVYWGTLLGCLEMILSGTTCVADGYFFEDAAVRAAHEAGIRVLMAQGIIDFPAPGVPDPSLNLQVGRKFLEKWIDFSPLITPGLFCHSPVTCSPETLKGAMAMSREFSLPLQIHLSETVEEVDHIMKITGKRPVRYLEGLGLLSDQLIAVHAIHLDDDELACLSRRHVRIVHVPESNMKLSSGLARAVDMVRMGLFPGLGTDGCASNNNLDLFQEMDTAAKLHKAFSLNPLAMNAETVLKMATSWGSGVLGHQDRIGTIQVGKRADIITVDLRRPHLVPIYNPMSHLVYSANGADVKDLMVNGKILMKDREVKTLDTEEILQRVTAIGHEIRI